MKQTEFPNFPPSMMAFANKGPFDLVGISKRADKDIKNIELFTRAAHEGVSRRVAEAFLLFEPDPITAGNLMLEARSLAVQAAQLATDYVEIGFNTVRKFSLASLWDFLTRKKDPDIFKDLRERAREIAMEFGFPYDVQVSLGVKVPPLPPLGTSKL